MVLLVVVLLGLAAILTVAVTPTETKTVTAHFPRAVSVYDGTEVRILGVPVGEVTAVIPEGNSVRVEMEYDAQYDVPADAKAVIVTPTLVADRFVQLTPVYEGGPTHGRRRGDRAAGHRRPGRAGPDLREPADADPGARTQRRQRRRDPRQPAEGADRTPSRARAPRATRCCASSPPRRRPSATAPARCSTRSPTWPSSPPRSPRTTSWSGPSCRTSPVSRRRSRRRATSSSRRWRRWPARSATWRGSSATTATRSRTTCAA